MPIVTTITIITLLRGGAGNNGLLNPAWLRERIEGGLEDSPSLGEALALVDKLDQLESRHNQAVRASLVEYTWESERVETDAEDLLEILAPRDRERLAVLEEAIAIRQSLLELLDEDEWDDVFG
jgi:hypothetical protein